LTNGSEGIEERIKLSLPLNSEMIRSNGSIFIGGCPRLFAGEIQLAIRFMWENGPKRSDFRRSISRTFKLTSGNSFSSSSSRDAISMPCLFVFVRMAAGEDPRATTVDRLVFFP